MKTFWKVVGKGFAKSGSGLIQVALWASNHPEVIGIVQSIVNK